MRIIDLLNKIANREEVPEKIKWNNAIFILKTDAMDGHLYYEEIDGIKSLVSTLKTMVDLNDEIEIIEEPEEIDIQAIEEIGLMLGWALVSEEETIEKQKDSINFTLDFFGKKINEIAEMQNKQLQVIKQIDNKLNNR